MHKTQYFRYGYRDRYEQPSSGPDQVYQSLLYSAATAMDRDMDHINEADIVKSNEYYASLLQDLDIITQPKDNKPFVLPESSVWNRLKLTSARIDDDHVKKDSGFSLEREILRIGASTDAELRHTSKSPRKCNPAFLVEHTMTARER